MKGEYLDYLKSQLRPALTRNVGHVHIFRNKAEGILQEIERLEKENEVLREALNKIGKIVDGIPR